MRKPNSAAQNPPVLQAARLRYILLVVMIPTAFAIAFCGCSQLQKPTSFEPMPQPKSLTQRQQRPVEQILQRQDEIRLAAEQAAAEAGTEAEALAANAEEAVSDVDEAIESQQEDIVAQAAERANALQPLETEFKIAQVSYESEIEPATETETESKSEEQTSTSDSVDSNVKLIANADDMEGVPVNVAGDEIDFSSANFLRPSTTAAAQTPGTDELTNNKTEAPPTPFGNAESLSLPLQPMLFNPATRTKNSTLEGTLRPLQTASSEIEPQIEVARTIEPPQIAGPSVEPPNSFGPLAPLRADTSTSKAIKLQSPMVSPDMGNTFASRLLTPGKQAVETIPTPTILPPTVAASKVVYDAEPIVVSEATATDTNMDIVVGKFDPPTPLVPLQQRTFPGQPVVDESLSQFSANYLPPKTSDSTVEVQPNKETYVPSEILEDSIVVAEAVKRELAAMPIPSVSIHEDNDFKILPASNTTIAKVCPDCGSDNCESCEHDDLKHGKPLFTNNDFAAPASPGGDFTPMAVPPAAIPEAGPNEFVAASPEFGKPVSLKAPPESDAVLTRVAALSVTGFSSAPVASNSNVPPVGVSTLMELNAVTWKSRLDEAIELAETRLNRINSPADASIVNLRLLKALRGQMEQVEDRPATGEYSENESQYWQHQLEAITTMLGSPVSTGENPAVTDYHRHQTAHATLEHLRSAVAQLESIASLKVTSGQFCTEITGFGQFRTFPSNAFSAGQKMLVYCEVENYKTVGHQTATGNDFRTRLRGSFAIYDADGKVVQQAEFPTVDDVARKRRRDFYMYMPVTLGDLPAGQYVLHALVEDIYGNKTASLDPPLKFSVK